MNTLLENTNSPTEAPVSSPEFPLIGLHVFLINESVRKILLIKRANTGFYDGLWAAPAGRLEKWETFSMWAKRELLEEVWLVAKNGTWNKPYIAYNKEKNGGCLHVYYACNEWEWTPVNMEPHKCDGMDWFDLDSLPENIIPHVRNAIIKIIEL